MANALFLFLLTALVVACCAFYRAGRWRQRARAAEKRAVSNKQARTLQDDVALDPALRERVRREFDRP